MEKVWKALPRDQLCFTMLSRRTIMSMAVGLFDLASILLSLVAASLLRTFLAQILEPVGWSRHLLPESAISEFLSWSLLMALILVAVYSSRGLYPGTGLSPVEEIRRLTLCTTLGVFMLFVINILTKTSTDFLRLMFLFSWGYLLFLVPLGRLIAKCTLCHFNLWGEYVAMIGDSEHLENLIQKVEDHPHVGYIPVLSLKLDNGRDRDYVGCLKTHFEEAQMEAPRKSIDTALVALGGMRSSAMEVSRVLEPYFRQVNLILPEGVLPLGLVEMHQIGSLPALRVRNALADHKALVVKRIMDAILGGILTLATFPILMVIALAIKVDSPGPVIFVQKRIGKGGGEFPMFKFRTMYQDAESRLETILARDPDGKLEWDSYQKLKNDPRVTRVGKFLREFSLDELPQLWNVLRGEMSVVGPRPFFEDQKEEYGEAYERYIRVPPGITGAWQVNGRNHTSFKERAAMDEYYVRNWSIWLDLYILALTPIAVFTRRGAY